MWYWGNHVVNRWWWHCVEYLIPKHDVTECSRANDNCYVVYSGPINREMRNLISSLKNHNEQLKVEVQRYKRRLREAVAEITKVTNYDSVPSTSHTLLSRHYDLCYQCQLYDRKQHTSGKSFSSMLQPFSRTFRSLCCPEISPFTCRLNGSFSCVFLVCKTSWSNGTYWKMFIWLEISNSSLLVDISNKQQIFKKYLVSFKKCSEVFNITWHIVIIPTTNMNWLIAMQFKSLANWESVGCLWWTNVHLLVTAATAVWRFNVRLGLI